MIIVILWISFTVLEPNNEVGRIAYNGADGSKLLDTLPDVVILMVMPKVDGLVLRF